MRFIVVLDEAVKPIRLFSLKDYQLSQFSVAEIDTSSNTDMTITEVF